MIGASAKDVSIDASSLAIASTAVDSSIPTDSAVVVSPPGLLLCPSDPVTADLMVVVVVDVVVVVVVVVVFAAFNLIFVVVVVVVVVPHDVVIHN